MPTDPRYSAVNKHKETMHGKNRRTSAFRRFCMGPSVYCPKTSPASRRRVTKEYSASS